MNLDHLNTAQAAAVTTTEGPLIIVACAGSGKTTVLINRVAYLISEKNVEPESILLLTFTNAAAQNMIDRASKMLDDRCSRVTACTYHSFCAKMLRKFGSAINLDPSFTTLTVTDVTDAINFIKAKNPIYKEKGFPRASVLADIFSSSVNRDIPINVLLQEKVFKKYELYSSQIIQLWKEYTVYKRAKNLCDFDDLLVHFNSLLNNEFIRSQINKKFSYVMVDEYQDTNNLQEQIILKMCGKNGNLAIVGDDYQSIYKFRGSNVNNFLHFPEKLNNCKKITLDINYRSTEEILNLANTMMKEHADFGFPKTMKANNKTGIMPKLVMVNNQSEETAFVFNKINSLMNEGVSLSDIAIIERNSFSSASLESMLDLNGISFTKLGGIKFLEHTCVQDMLAYLRCMTNPLDELGWFRILKLHPGIGDTYARNLATLCSIDRNFLENNPYKKRTFYKELLLLKSEVEKNKPLDFHDAFDNFLKFYLELRERVIDEMDTDENSRDEYREALDSEKETLKILKDLSLLYTTTLKFLDDLTLDNSKIKNTDNGILTITTIHSAKGLEWNYVFILDCIEGVIPNDKALENKEELDEELRCFYVAMTRAGKELYLIHPMAFVKYGDFSYTTRSSFLENCEESFEYVDERGY